MTACTIPVTDVWGPGTLNPDKITAYKQLDTRGVIKVQRVHMSRADVTTFRYLAAQSEAETHQLLKEAFDGIEKARAET